MKTNFYFFISLLCCFVFGCQHKQDEQEGALTQKNNTPTVADTIRPQTTPSDEKVRYLVLPQEFFGIRLADTISALQHKFPGRLEKAIKRTGEGNFTVYKIKNKKGEYLADIYPELPAAEIVGQIDIFTPRAMTTAEIKIGDTYAQLLQKGGEVAVHGSEIEGRTYALYNGIFYRLAMNHFTYELDPATIINPDVKITAIVIHQ
ncbi:hypothetical protein [Pontibacter chitinilyticus]|uniref:hypothetical protein n=1 Tax=Pontibacter chitinilyticus TaxID=2674989 RepID=UPI00321AAFCC